MLTQAIQLEVKKHHDCPGSTQKPKVKRPGISKSSHGPSPNWTSVPLHWRPGPFPEI